MQLNFARRFSVSALVWAAVTFLPMRTAAAPHSDIAGLSKLVSGLYMRYAWVAVFSTTLPANAVPLAQASRAELQAIFVPDLAKAIWDDAQCAEKRGEICTVDFDILFDSQDPSASGLTIQSETNGSAALACFEVASEARKCLKFVGADIQGAARVADIIYPNQRSLRQLLLGPK